MTQAGQSDTVTIPRDLADAMARAISYLVDQNYGVEGTSGVGPPTGYILERCREEGIATEWRVEGR